MSTYCDDRFVSWTVVLMVRIEKRRRQFIFATHNANIPVLDDAEQIVAIDADGDAGRGRTRVEPDHVDSIDLRKVAVKEGEI